MSVTFFFSMHNLDITYSNSRNNKSFTIIDNSVYNTELPITNIILEIKIPGQTCFKSFILSAGWCRKTFTCVDFETCCIGSDLAILPDGIYEIKYSVDPNLSTMIEIQHMRIAKFLTDYTKVLGLYLSNKYNFIKEERLKIEKELIIIHDTILSSVYAVEECLDNTGGLELYKEAVLRLNKINNGDYSNCY